MSMISSFIINIDIYYMSGAVINTEENQSFLRYLKVGSTVGQLKQDGEMMMCSTIKKKFVNYH